MPEGMRELQLSHDGKATVMWSLAHLFQMIALALGDAPDAFLLCICHKLAPDQQRRTLHEKSLNRYFRFILEQAEFLFPITRLRCLVWVRGGPLGAANAVSASPSKADVELEASYTSAPHQELPSSLAAP